jgi:hypothetical protein
MLFASLFFLQTAAGGPATAQQVRGGTAPSFDIPRVVAADSIAIDGNLSDPAWASAALLTGFHQYEPSDAQPAAQETAVRVLYSPTALYFGIVAHVRPGSNLSATVSNRDNILNDDRVLIYLDTFNDRRRAFVFGVNPYGVQLDGVRSEGSGAAGQRFGFGEDWSPDFHFESRGTITDSGYVVEVRIPFKSLRFPPEREQSWGLNISRITPSTNTTDTWVDARRASASFLGQSGTMHGITDVERGIVTEWQPFVTAVMNGSRDDVADEFSRGSAKGEAGLNVRVGFPAVSLDATINPDFSQVETDVGQVTANERFALFIPEKRPFFLEGIELFNTPNQLVYTRRVVSPSVGAKLTGKVGRFNMAWLAALDDRPGDDALFNISRLRTDLGGNSFAGVTLTDRRLEGHSNTVVAADTRIVFGRLYFFEAQAGQSRTTTAGVTTTAPLYHAVLDRTGQLWGFHYELTGFGEDFESEAGFIERNDNVNASFNNRLAFYGSSPRSLVQSLWFFGGPERLWRYDDFGSSAALEGGEDLRATLNLRGGWRVNANVERSFFSLEPEQYEGLSVPVAGGLFDPYTPSHKLDNLWNGELSVNLPSRRMLDASVTLSGGAVAIFAEGSEGRSTRIDAEIGLRPTPSIRLEALAAVARLTRAHDGSEFSRTVIPRLKVEYQPLRSFFLRVVGELRDERRDALRAAGSSTVLYLDGVQSVAAHGRSLRTDWLISYEPSPGTVAFFGYGNTLERPETQGARGQGMRLEQDGFFVKVAYRFRR